MPKFTIDGKAYEYEGKPMLLQYCIDNEIEIPYFCYHPSMSIPTNCRMCLVEVGWYMKDRQTGEIKKDDKGNPLIQWGRKPNTSCNTPITPDMIVKTHRTSESVRIMQKGVLEYMLINHPLDCPICDQAGECPLQIWTYKYGPEGSRFEVNKITRGKRIDLGPNVMLDADRCINCTRCTRFTEEVSKSNQLTIVSRGEKNRPSTAPGQPFDDPYSMNVIDLCPVGALTSKNFRFKARAWEMAYGPSIDMNDSTGTNINVWIRDNKVLRITPRVNLEVNEYWIPDAHRLNIGQYNDNRVSGIKTKGDIPVDFEAGIQKAGELLSNHTKGHIELIGSAYASLESNYALRELGKALGIEKIWYIPHEEKGAGDGWLIQDDRTPNAAACERLGFQAISAEDLKHKFMNDGPATLFYALENDRFFSMLTKEDLANHHTLIVHATQYQPCFEAVNVLLPAATAIEGEGIYINHKGKAQVSRLIKEIHQMTPDMYMRIPKGRLDKAAVPIDRWRDGENIFDVLPSWLLVSKVSRAANAREGLPLKEHKDVFARLRSEFEDLREMKISYRVPKEAFKFTQYDFAIT